jgi:glycosyltransferase involved in cell wall biosynthesis
MADKLISPDFIFESSWEVCNKVGGIYTVLSTRAKTLQDKFNDKLVFIGPDFWIDRENALFIEDKKLWPSWVKKATEEGLHIRVGRWNIPGQPYVVLVDFTPFYSIKNDIYAEAWDNYQVDSLHAYGDYDEASMFAYAAAKVVESFYNHSLTKKKNVVYQVHEWMTCLGALYIQKYVPQIATIFTTHATSIGRSIAGNHKPLYDYLWAYNGCQMAQELNMESKHSVERQTAHNVDCFTTVSDVTANECKELLDKECDAVLMNGFEQDFVPKGAKFTASRKKARQQIFRIANALIGTEFTDDTLVVATSGRYEYKNKGIDVFLESMYRGLYEQSLKRPVLALVQVPGWMDAPRIDLQDRLKHDIVYDTPLIDPLFTHTLHYQENDSVLNFLHSHGIRNNKESQVKVIFVPCYLDGNDGIFNMPYYDLLIGNDLAVYPSYYEPWGYTPLEAIAFNVPCITTSLSGFGLWANKELGHQSKIQDGVEVIVRNDYNFSEVVDNIVSSIATYSALDVKKQNAIRKKAGQLSEKALWKHFIEYYFEAYNIALRNRNKRIGK